MATTTSAASRGSVTSPIVALTGMSAGTALRIAATTSAGSAPSAPDAGSLQSTMSAPAGFRGRHQRRR